MCLSSSIPALSYIWFLWGYRNLIYFPLFIVPCFLSSSSLTTFLSLSLSSRPFLFHNKPLTSSLSPLSPVRYGFSPISGLIPCSRIILCQNRSASELCLVSLPQAHTCTHTHINTHSYTHPTLICMSTTSTHTAMQALQGEACHPVKYVSLPFTQWSRHSMK